MSKNDTGLPGFLKGVVPPELQTLSLSALTQSLLNASSRGLTGTLDSLQTSSGLKAASETAELKLQSIQFGKPGSNVTSTSSSGSVWGGLLSSSLSGGISNALGGGLGSLAGLGGLISGITSLFGGSSATTPPPLQLFSLPDSIRSNVVIGSVAHGGTVPPSTPTSAVYGNASQSVYSTSSAAKTAGPSTPPVDNSAIAAAVKNALLTSNTLGDVIAEI